MVDSPPHPPHSCFKGIRNSGVPACGPKSGTEAEPPESKASGQDKARVTDELICNYAAV